MSQERQNTTGNPGGSYSDGPGQASPHVNFSSRSPSILPTPIYDDSSTVMSSPAPLHISSPLVNATLPQTFDPAPISIPFSPQNIHPPPSDPDHFSKIQVEDDYGPTFQQEVEKPGHANLLGRLRGNQGFIPLKDNDEEDRFFYNPESSENRFAPPSEQNRANTFMNNLKGDPENNLYDERANEQQQRGMYNEHDPAYSMPKNRGALYGLVLGPTPFPFFTWGTAFAMLGVFIFELIRNSALTGNWIQISPINPMIGPSSLALINIGGLFSPCMRDVSEYSTATVFNDCFTSGATCSLETLCGFGGFGGSVPNQSFRFFTPIFIHAGIIHILMNLIAHIQLGGQIERTLGLVRYTILYIGSGIFGFVLSGLLSGTSSPSMGCSGALFGLIGYSLIELIFEWRSIAHPVRELVKIIIITAISLVIGLLPGIDNFAHIGGLLMGILLSVFLSNRTPLASKGSKVMIWIVKGISLCLAIILFAVLLNKFYTASDLDTVCPQCKYFSCLPVNGWCDVK